MGIAVVRAWPGTAGATRSTWGSRECSWSTPEADRNTEAGEGAGGAPFGGGSEDGAGRTSARGVRWERQ